MDGRILEVCATHHPRHAIILLWIVVIVLNFRFKELRFGLHADSIILVDFLHVTGSTEGGFISLPNAFKYLVSFAAITVSLTHPGMYFALVCLVCSGACLSIRVDKVE